jgi:dihydroorotate dehydrogenase
MYKLLIRPFFFLFDPERVHHWVSWMLRFFFMIPGKSWAVRKLLRVEDDRLRRTVFGIEFPNPVGVAGGFDKETRLFNALYNLGFSHVEIGTVTPRPQPGNAKPRLFRIPADKALINRMGFNNAGAADAAQKLRKSQRQVIIGGNIGKNTATPNENAVADYVHCFRELYEVVDYFIINVSCPNITDLHELQDGEGLQRIVKAVIAENRTTPRPKPVLLKVAPDLNEGQLDEVIKLVKEEGLDGVVATNTSISRGGLSISPEQIKALGNGGLSGLPLKDRSTQVIRYLAEKSGKAFPIIGVGGIMTPADAIEKLEAGADLVQVYTGFIYEGPALARRINKAILRRLP